VELRKPAKEQIITDINSIYTLLEENKDKLADLRKQLGKSNYQVKELEKMVENMTRQLKQKDEEIAALTDMLNQMDIKITALTKNVQRLEEEGEVKSQTILEQTLELEEQTIAINTAYYIVGSKKELKDANIITSEGGFIGIGREKKLADDFDVNMFTQIDIREVSQIMISGKKIELVTSHPTESYSVEEMGDEIVLGILDAEAFWKNSKYLVIVVQ
jgi:predicted RNase H-like nuclease (RuvC/YqgF family)